MGENINNASEDRKEILFKEKKLILLLIPAPPPGHQPLPPGRTEFFFFFKSFNLTWCHPQPVSKHHIPTNYFYFGIMRKRHTGQYENSG